MSAALSKQAFCMTTKPFYLNVAMLFFIFIFAHQAFANFADNPKLTLEEQRQAMLVLRKMQYNLPHIIARKASTYDWALKKADFHFWLRRYMQAVTSSLYHDLWSAYHTSYSPIARNTLLEVCEHNLANLRMRTKIFTVMGYHVQKALKESGSSADLEAYYAFEVCQKKQLDQSRQMLETIHKKLTQKRKRP